MERAFDAAVFDLDGVITFTARVHAAAWKQLFDEYLRSREIRFGEPFRPFDEEDDYHNFVDGKPRYDGVRSFLEARGIRVPRGTPADPPNIETVCGLGNRKNDLFNRKIEELGVAVDGEAVRFTRALRDLGVHVGLASSSKNAKSILRQAGLLDLFEAIVDGRLSEKLGLHGKPAPDIFVTCLERMTPHGDRRRAMVVEDAISGVEAGRRGGFGLVLGVARTVEPNELREHGADLVIRSFAEVTPAAIDQAFRSKAA